MSAIFVGLAIAAVSERPFRVVAQGAISKEELATIERMVSSSVQKVEAFFGEKYLRGFTVTVYEHRAAVDEEFKRRWNAPPTEKWMVGAATADGMLLLAPSSWRSEAAEHDGSDSKHVEQILTHELTHTFHGQRNPRREFDGMEDMAWFVEGLATYVAGQNRRRPGYMPVKPGSLASAWSGNDRYYVSGSLVGYIDRTYGRRTLIALLKETSNAGILKALGTYEQPFLSRWFASLSK